MKIHELKVWMEFWPALLSGRKTFEIRENDRDYQVDDILVLKCYDANACTFVGPEMRRTVTYMTTWEQQPGFVVLGLSPLIKEALVQVPPRRTPVVNEQAIIRWQGSCAIVIVGGREMMKVDYRGQIMMTGIPSDSRERDALEALGRDLVLRAKSLREVAYNDEVVEI